MTFGFAQNLHSARLCTDFAQDFLPEDAHRITIYIAIISYLLILFGQ
jgi:hypothetical protein